MGIRRAHRFAPWVLGALALAAGLGGCGGSSHTVARAACSWHLQRAGSSSDDDLTGVSFPDTTHGWAVGGIDSADVLATSDGGATWRLQHTPVRDDGLSEVSFVDDRHGWAVGVHNTLIATSDGGATWTYENPRVSQDGNLYSVSFVDRDHGWVVGDHGVIRATSDGGRTWMPESAGTDHELSDVQFVDRLHGWINAGDEILRTTDGGAHWSVVHTTDATHQEELAGVFFLSSRQGWVSGSEYEPSDFYGTIAQTTDGGNSWAHVEVTAFDDVHFWAIAFLDARHGWVTGVQGEIFYTDDGGKTWADRSLAAEEGTRMIAMVFRDPRHGWAVGQQGTIEACT